MKARHARTRAALFVITLETLNNVPALKTCITALLLTFDAVLTQFASVVQPASRLPLTPTIYSSAPRAAPVPPASLCFACPRSVSACFHIRARAWRSSAWTITPQVHHCSFQYLLQISAQISSIQWELPRILQPKPVAPPGAVLVCFTTGVRGTEPALSQYLWKCTHPEVVEEKSSWLSDEM